MVRPFQVGDRVRLRPGHRYPEFRPGDTGVVTAVLPATAAGGAPLYQVRMDREARDLYASFYTDELELLPR